jgi:chromosome partitioning protein
VTVIDMDYQQSIAQKYERAKLLENTEPYTVVAASLEHFPGMKNIMSTQMPRRSYSSTCRANWMMMA